MFYLVIYGFTDRSDLVKDACKRNDVDAMNRLMSDDHARFVNYLTHYGTFSAKNLLQKLDKTERFLQFC
jgi:hypothetical protein